MHLNIQVRSLATSSALLLHDLAIGIPGGHIHTVMGASGSGKSSLLAAVCGTLDAGLRFEGEISLGGRPIAHLPTEQRRVGILFQDDLLFAHMSVSENLLFAVPPGHRQIRQARVVQALRDIELQHLADANPATLSGGQRSRVALMRAFLAEPQALLLDEPYASLDLPNQALLHRDIAQAKAQIMVSTHVLDHVRHFERVIWLDKGQVRADGTGLEVCAAYEADVAARTA